MKERFEAFVHVLSTMPGVTVHSHECTDTFGRITWKDYNDIEFVTTTRVIGRPTPAEQAEQEGREFEGGPTELDTEANPVPVHVTIACEEEDDKHERSSN